jgi:hypothetical protein
LIRVNSRLPFFNRQCTPIHANQTPRGKFKLSRGEAAPLPVGNLPINRRGKQFIHSRRFASIRGCSFSTANSRQFTRIKPQEDNLNFPVAMPLGYPSATFQSIGEASSSSIRVDSRQFAVALFQPPMHANSRESFKVSCGDAAPLRAGNFQINRRGNQLSHSRLQNQRA